ncbi:MAG: PKD domain-containing protein [Bacteroidetes bacterium]|nr:PKD domain-containing protein [Bacteroidota bacterium]
MKKVLFVLLLICFINSQSQTIANYASARNTGVAYSSIITNGSAFANWRNTVSFTQDDNRSDFTDIGFDFWYNGIRYTQFSVSTNGFIDFSNSTDDGGPIADDFGYSNAAFTTVNAANATRPAIAPFYDDLTAQGGVDPLGGSIKYYLSGVAPIRTLTIEWINMAVYQNTTPSLNFQVMLIETSGLVLINYGTMATGTKVFSYSMGLNANTMSAIPTAAQLKMLQTVNTNVLNNTVQNNLSAMPAANSQYIFTPPVPSNPVGAIAFSGITQSAMTLNWSDWASNEVGYVIYNSTDGVNYNFVTQTLANATSANVTGLTSSTNYFWKLHAVTEGYLSNSLNGTQATIAGINKISNQSGLWSNSAIWTPTGVPTSGDNVTISDGTTVSINVTGQCNNLTVGTGGTASLRYSTNTTCTLTVSKDILVNANSSFSVDPASSAIHVLLAVGSITNNGKIDFSSGGQCNLFLSKIGNASISGTGITNTFRLIDVNMGGASGNVLDINSSNFSASNGFLTLNSGTVKFSTVNAINVVPFLVSTTISQYAGLWINSATAVVTTSSGIVLSGKLTVSNGTLNIGNQTSEDVLSSGGALNISNGALNIAGKYYSTGLNNISNFSISGGTLTLPTFGSASTIDAPFQIAGLGSSFNMTGGMIIVRSEGGAGPQNLGFTNTGSSSGVITSGTLQIGNSTSPANQIININTNTSIGNLVVNSPNLIANIITNNLNIVNDVVINSGSFAPNALQVTLGGNWKNNGGVFTPSTSTVIFNSGASQSIFKSGGETFNHLVFSGAGVKTFSSAITANGNLTLNAGSTIDVSTSNYQLTLRGNLINNGTFNTNNGLVLLNGTAAQTIGGSSLTNFFDLTLNNSTGAGLSSAQSIRGSLSLNNGIFSTNFNSFTLLSNSLTTARIAQITGSGDINGFVTVQRFAPGGTTGWALIGTPIATGLSFSDWDDNIAISCPTCPDGFAANFYSIYSYDETASGSYSNAAAYIPINTINDPITPNKGYWVYLGDGQYTTNDITIDVIGQVRKFNQSIPLNYTNFGSPLDDGWNLIHNPYPSPISWTVLKGATSNLDNAVYAYNADLNGGAGAHATYINGISSPAIAAGGIGDVIPMCQTFYVHSTGATALNGTEAAKVSGNQAFLKSSSAQNTNSLVRLKMKGPFGFIDESVLYIQPGATNNFDGSYDAIKMAGQDPYAPIVALEEANTQFQVNGISPISGTFTTSLKTLTGYSGSYTISASELTTFPIGSCFNLYDKYTATSTDLNTSNYIFNLADTTTVARFILSITLNPLQIITNVTQPTCQNLGGGQITATGLSAGPWNYYWKDVNSNIVKTSLNKNTSDTLSGLFNGSFNLDINTVGMCDNNQSSYTIIQQDPLTANFSCIDTCYLAQNPVVQFNNTTSNAASQYWDFGDNSGFSNSTSPNYQYTSAGVYTVSLIANSNSGCADTAFKTIVVSSLYLGIKNNQTGDGDFVVKNFGNNKFLIEKNLTGLSVLNYYIADASGKIVLSENKTQVTRVSIELDLNRFKSGVYFLNINLNEKYTVIKLPVNN